MIVTLMTPTLEKMVSTKRTPYLRLWMGNGSPIFQKTMV